MADNDDENSSSYEGEDLDHEKGKGESVGKSKASKPRHRILIKDWLDMVLFDEMSNVDTICNYDYLVLCTTKLQLLSIHYFISPVTTYTNGLLLIIYFCSYSF